MVTLLMISSRFIPQTVKGENFWCLIKNKGQSYTETCCGRKTAAGEGGAGFSE